jgi:translation elongation factor EF-1beta
MLNLGMMKLILTPWKKQYDRWKLMVLFGDKVKNSKAYIFLFLFFLAKHVPVAFGVKKVQINCVVEDDKVSHFILFGFV